MRRLVVEGIVLMIIVISLLGALWGALALIQIGIEGGTLWP